MAGTMRRLRRMEHLGGRGCSAVRRGAAEAAAERRARTSPHSLAAEAALEQPRLTTGSAELDRVLGGGLVPGSVTLIGGDPGIGKSTLMLQAGGGPQWPGPVLYATGEESLKQVALARPASGARGRRPRRLIAETQVEEIVGAASSLRRARSSSIRFKPCIRSASKRRPAPSRSCANARRNWCASQRSSGTAVLLVGHVTKEGQIAGPRVLEHMVDTVLYFESDTGSRFRVLRSVKNRFGAANEIGVFAMVEQGLREVANPSAIFLSRHAEPVAGQRHHRDARGHALAADRSSSAGRRQPGREPAPGRGRHRWQSADHAARRGAPPRRACCCQGQDVFANVVGGVRLQETAGDLAIVLAARSSLHDTPVAAFADRVRRIGPRGRDSTGAVRRGALARGGEARLQVGAGAGSERARGAPSRA